jgi:hypothetical protein
MMNVYFRYSYRKDDIGHLIFMTYVFTRENCRSVTRKRDFNKRWTHPTHFKYYEVRNGVTDSIPRYPEHCSYSAAP